MAAPPTIDVESLEIEDERLKQSSSSERRPEEDGECTEEELIELSASLVRAYLVMARRVCRELSWCGMWLRTAAVGDPRRSSLRARLVTCGVMP